MRGRSTTAISGCRIAPAQSRDRQDGNTGINYGAVVEMTLRNGRHKLLEGPAVRPGRPATRGRSRPSTTWERVPRPLHLASKHCMVQVLHRDRAEAGLHRGAVLLDAARPRDGEWLDLHTHGDWFPARSTPRASDGLGGFGTAIDSLAAIKHLIYDTKKITGTSCSRARGQLGRPRGGPAALPQRAQVRQRDRMGRPDRLRHPARGRESCEEHRISRTARPSTCGASRSPSTCRAARSRSPHPTAGPPASSCRRASRRRTGWTQGPTTTLGSIQRAQTPLYKTGRGPHQHEDGARPMSRARKARGG